MLRGSELFRLTTWIVLLVTTGLLIVRLRAPDAGPRTTQEPREDEPSVNEPEAGQPAGSVGTLKVEQVLVGPTDEDPEQRTDAAEEFQAIRDGTVGLVPEEMLAYWRLFYWVEHQSFTDLQRRHPGHVRFGDLMQFPDDNRGKLVSLDLNIRRVLSYDVANSPFDIARVYEVWAWSDDSKAWLYALVTAHLPEGMTVGAEVSYRGRFVGYFFKLHGYYEVGAKPRAAPLRAPLLVGRFQPIASVSQQKPSAVYDWLAVVAVSGMMVVLVAATVAQRLFARRSAQQQADRRKQTSATVCEWLRSDFPAHDVPLDGTTAADAAFEQPHAGEQSNVD